MRIWLEPRGGGMLSSIETLGRDLDPRAERWILSNDPIEQKFGGTVAKFWRDALDEL